MKKSAVVLLPRSVNWSRLLSPVPGVAPGTKVSNSATERIDWSSICFSEMTVSACGILRMSVFVLVAVLKSSSRHTRRAGR